MNVPTQRIDVNNLEIVVPAEYSIVQSMPQDPADSVPLMYETEGALCLVMLFPIPQNKAMPFSDPEDVVDGIHSAMQDNQGLIEVDSGATKLDRPYILSIVKTVKEEEGVQYTLTCHIRFDTEIINVQGFFGETGITGVRDAVVFEMARRDGRVALDGDGYTGWASDPYDPEFSWGVPRNLSEDALYDPLFPNHPVSVLRAFVSTLLSTN